MKFSKIAGTLTLGLMLQVAANLTSATAATLTYDWTLTSPGVSSGGFAWAGNGMLTVTTGNSSDLITAFSGSVTDLAVTGASPTAITGLIGAGTSETLGTTDNLLFPIGTTFTGPPSFTSVSDLDGHGIAFNIAGETIDIVSTLNPSSTPTGPVGNDIEEFSPAGFGVGQFSVELAPTPLPATLPLSAGGLSFVGYLARRRKHKRAFAAAYAG